MEGTVPEGTSAIRISIAADTGPKVTLTVLSGSQIVTQGERDAGWGVYENLTIPVKPVPRPISNARICLAFGPAIEPIEILGSAVPVTAEGGRAGRVVKFRVEYLRPGDATWWSMVSSVARRMGLGHAPSGTWIVFLLIGLMIAVSALAALLVLRELAMSRRPAANAGGTGGKILRRIPSVLRRAPRAAWVCALIACLNAVCWSLITPPFQLPDEPSHYAYVQQLAETRTLPTSSAQQYSEEEEVALIDLHWLAVRWHPENHPVASQAQQRTLEHDLARPLGRVGTGGAGVAVSQPPLYYALQTIPYAIGSSGSLLDRLALMRLLSA
jgi:hypothetical protein